jgi:hypothetical protein
MKILSHPVGIKGQEPESISKKNPPPFSGRRVFEYLGDLVPRVLELSTLDPRQLDFGE